MNRQYSQAYVNPGPWYKERNAKIYDQARTMTRQQIADYWKLDTVTIRYILNSEMKRRSDNPLIPA